MSHDTTTTLARLRGSGIVFCATITAVVLLVFVPRPAGAQGEEHGTLRPVTVDAFGEEGMYGFQRLYQFEGHLWMVAGHVDGVQVLRSSDGETWEAVTHHGMDGSPENDSGATMAWFRGKNDPSGSQGQLYFATYRYRADGPFAGDIWRSANALAEDPEDVEWEKVIERTELPDEWSDVQAFVGFATLKDQLYVGTFVNNFPEESGAEIFRTDTGDPGDWHVVTPNGMDDPMCNTDFHWNIVFGDHLYIGSEEAGCIGHKGGEIWRTNGDGLTDDQRTLDGWEKVMAQPGFGHPYNNNIFGLDVFKDHMYGATWNWNGGMEVFRAPVVQPHEGENPVPFDWEQVSVPGVDGDPRNNVNVSLIHLGDTLYVLGIDLYGAGNGYFFRTNGAATATEHLTSWTEITDEGFPPQGGRGSNNTAVPVPILPLDGPFWLETFKNKIYIAVEMGGHPEGSEQRRGQLWVYEPNDVPDFALHDTTLCAAPDDEVVLTGTGFDDFKNDSSARLDNWPLSDVQKWTDTEIVVTLPDDAESGDLTVYKDGMWTDPKPLNVVHDRADCHTGPPGGELSGPPYAGNFGEVVGLQSSQTTTLPGTGPELPLAVSGAVLLMVGALLRRGDDEEHPGARQPT